MTAGLWPQIQAGSPSNVMGVYAERLAADRELFGQLSIEQLEILAEESQRLVDRATAMVNGTASSMLVGVSASPAAGADDVAGRRSTEPPGR